MEVQVMTDKEIFAYILLALLAWGIGIIIKEAAK